MKKFMKNLMASHTPLRESFIVFLSIALFSLLTRLSLPPLLNHLPNFSALDALALFCGAYFSHRLAAFLVILFSVWMGDILISKLMLGNWLFFYSGFYWQYATYCLIVLLGSHLLKNKIKLMPLMTACLASSIIFFTISNFGVWFSSSLYPSTLDGLIACYVAAIPFFKNTLVSDLFFSLTLFGMYELLRMLPAKLTAHSENAYLK